MALSLYFSTWIHLFPNTNESTSSWWSPHVSHFNPPISSYFPRSFPSFWWNPYGSYGSYGIFRFRMAPWRNPWHSMAAPEAEAPKSAMPEATRRRCARTCCSCSSRPSERRRQASWSSKIRWRFDGDHGITTILSIVYIYILGYYGIYSTVYIITSIYYYIYGIYGDILSINCYHLIISY